MISNCGEDEAVCDNTTTTHLCPSRSISKRPTPPSSPPAVFIFDGQPLLPAVKKVKLEDAISSGTLLVKPPVDVLSDVELKCDYYASDGSATAATEVKKIAHSPGKEAGLFNVSTATAALQLKRENSAEEAKFDIYAETPVVPEKKGATATKADILLSAAAVAAEMKLEIAKIDSILQGRLLLDTAAAGSGECELPEQKRGSLKEEVDSARAEQKA
jgi:hypothetical protein